MPKNRKRRNRMGDTIYGFGLVEALFFYLQYATSLGGGLLGIAKAIVWPALLIYNLSDFLKIQVPS